MSTAGRLNVVSTPAEVVFTPVPEESSALGQTAEALGAAAVFATTQIAVPLAQTTAHLAVTGAKEAAKTTAFVATEVVVPLAKTTARLAVTGAKETAKASAFVATEVVVPLTKTAAELAVAGTKAGLASARQGMQYGKALTVAVANSLQEQMNKQQTAYQLQFEQRQQSLKAMLKTLKPCFQTTQNNVSQKKQPPPPANPETFSIQDNASIATAHTLLEQSQHLFNFYATEQFQQAYLHENLADLFVEITVFCQLYPQTQLTLALRTEVAATSDALKGGTSADRWSVTEKLKALFQQAQQQLQETQERVRPLYQEAAGLMTWLEQGVEYATQIGAEQAVRQWEELQQRWQKLEPMVLAQPDVAEPALQDLLQTLRQQQSQGQQRVQTMQQQALSQALVEVLKDEKFAIISADYFGLDYRIAGSRQHPEEPSQKQRIVFKLLPDGELVFDVQEGFAGEQCLKTLAILWEKLGAKGYQFGTQESSIHPPTVLQQVAHDLQFHEHYHIDIYDLEEEDDDWLTPLCQ